MKFFHSRITATLPFCALLITVAVFAAAGQSPGSLDPAFGSGGIVVTSLSIGADRAFAVARQADGKIVAAGTRNNGQNMAVVRYLANGQLDNSFDGDGVFTLAPGVFGNILYAVAIQTDGKIVAAGVCTSGGNNLYTVIRLNADGSPDVSFSGDGLFTHQIADTPYGIAVQPDGKIVTAGDLLTNFGFQHEFSAARLNSDGTYDNTFDGDGRASVSFGQESPVSYGYGLALQTDGKIVIAGEANSAFGLARLNADGSPDNSFDADGRLRTQFTPGQNAFARSVAVASDGRVVVGGYGNENSTGGFAVARYNPDGSLDTTFSSDGKTVTPNTNQINAVAVQTDGRIVAVGYSVLSFAIARYRTDGALDPSFAGDGLVERRVNGNGFAIARGIVVGPGGEVTLAGNASTDGGPDEDIFIAKFAANGTPSIDLGVYGYVVTNPFNETGQSSHSTGTLVQPDGKILVCGNRTISPSITVGTIIRYTADGLLDPTFAGSTSGAGIATIGVPGSISQELNAVALQPDGKIVAVGSYETDEDLGTFVVRLNPDGSRDLVFGGSGNGFALIGFKYGGALGQDVALQPDGKILVGGASLDLETLSVELSALRLDSSGLLDGTFGANGVAKVDLGAGYSIAFSIARGPDGKIVLGGAANLDENGSNADSAVVRLNQNGTPDGSFGTDGKVVFSFSPSIDMIQDVSVRSDGKPIASTNRCIDAQCTAPQGGIMQLDPNGSPDISFDGDGIAELPFASSINSFTIQPNGKIVAGGESQSQQGDSDGFLARFSSNGSLDNSFGSNGIRVNNSPNTQQIISAVALGPDNKIIAAGETIIGQRSDIVVWRHIGDIGGGTNRTLFDYDGDRRSDLSVLRASNNVWYLLRATAGYTAIQFGEAGDRMTPADYDGDGKTDVSVFRPSNGTWYMYMSQSQTFQAFGWGENGDLPVPTDRDNDGRTDLVIFRPSNNTWYTRYANGTFHTFEFGVAGDKPVVGDFDGDGIGDVALFRPSNNNWYIIKSSLGFFIQTWGEAGDLPVTGDFDGDGATDQAVFRPSTGQWFLSQTTAGFSVRNWGQDGDVPVAADYDGDGRADVAVFRPSNSTWYIINSTAGILIQQFGEPGDVPTQTAFNY